LAFAETDHRLNRCGADDGIRLSPFLGVVDMGLSEPDARWSCNNAEAFKVAQKNGILFTFIPVLRTRSKRLLLKTEDRLFAAIRINLAEVLVPTEEVVELVKGKRQTSSRKFYPGYMLVKMELDDETWHIVNNTAKVTGFLGGREKPTPISEDEADQILNRMEAGKKTAA
jgi:hypothetical protein